MPHVGRATRRPNVAWRRLREPRYLLRVAALAVFSAAAAWLSVAVAAAGLFASVDPDLVLSLAPYNASAKASKAELVLARFGSTDDLERSAALARSALARDATMVPAWRVLGLAAEASGRHANAAIDFSIVEMLSKRDLPSQLWLIEQSVRENDIPGALAHYDEAMRTSTEIREQLVPVLVSATASPYVAPYLARLLAKDPEWAPLYYAAFIQAPATGAGGAALAADLRRLNPRLDLSELRPLPALLAQHGAFDDAQRAYRALSGGGSELLRNGDFERANRYPSIDWDLTDEDNLIAEPVALDGAGGQLALEIRSAYGASGRAARQLLFLQPGAYRLLTTVGAASQNPLKKLSWQLACANNGAALLEHDIARQSPGRSRVQLSFQVPAGCPAQWLTLQAEASDAPDEAEAWIDDVALQPIG